MKCTQLCKECAKWNEHGYTMSEASEWNVHSRTMSVAGRGMYTFVQ